MNKLIVVCGLSGSGKTTLAKELSKELKIACIHKDSIKERLFESLGLSTLEDSKRIGKPSVGVLLYLAQQQIENGVDVIIESPFNFEEDYEIFREWERRYGIKIFSVICSISKDERLRRKEERVRHYSHMDTLRREETFEGIDFDNEFDYKNIPGKQIRVVTNKSLSGLLDKIIQEINGHSSRI